MPVLLIEIFLASLLGSLHCAGMCGGFVAFYAGSAPGGLRRAGSHAAYHGGRFLTYAMLGLLAGFLGAALDLAGSVAGLQRGAALLAGALIVLWGVVALLRARGVEIFKTVLPAPAKRFASRVLGALGDSPPALRAMIIGLLTTFLPCGWLYIFVLVAAGTGSALGGLAAMIAFWAGTVPILLALGFGVQLLAAPLRKRLPTVTAAALLVVGLTLVFGRVEKIGVLGGARDARKPTSVEEAADRVKNLDPSTAPCCGDGVEGNGSKNKSDEPSRSHDQPSPRQ